MKQHRRKMKIFFGVAGRIRVMMSLPSYKAGNKPVIRVIMAQDGL